MPRSPRRRTHTNIRTAKPQLPLPFPATWGGRRRGSGRKPGPNRDTPHRARPTQRATEPVHVTLRSRLAPLRSQHVFPTVRLAVLRAGRRDPTAFRIVHFSVQRDHVHLIVEARDKRALSAGVRSVAIRIARYVNDLLSRRGPLWAQRWHGRALASPRAVRNALVYVLANFRKHARVPPRAGIDPYSSGVWFDGWRGFTRTGRAPPLAAPAPWLRVHPARHNERPSHDEGTPRAERDGCPVSPPRTWLARTGWRRHGLVSIADAPAS